MNDLDFSDLIPQSGALAPDGSILVSGSANATQNGANQENSPQNGMANTGSPKTSDQTSNNVVLGFGQQKDNSEENNTKQPIHDPSNMSFDDLIPSSKAYSPTDTMSSGEQAFRQVGLAGRDLAGAVPKVVSGTADMVNAGVNAGTGLVNKYAGTNIPQLRTNLTGDVDKGLTAVGFPAPENKIEKAGSDVASTLFGAGENAVPMAKQAIGEAGNLIGAGASATAAPFKTTAAGYALKKPEALAQESEDMRNDANMPWVQMRANGAVMHQDNVNQLSSKVGAALANKDILPKLTPVTSDVAQQISDAADSGPLSLNHLDQMRYQLKGATGRDAAAAGAVRNVIAQHIADLTGDDLVNGSPDAVAWLNRGRAESSRAMAFDDVSTVLQKANGDPTKIKNMLNTFLANDKNTQFLTDDEKTILGRAAQTSAPEAMTKMLGKAGFTIIPTNASGNGVLPYVMAAGKAGATVVPGGIPLVAAGTVAKAGQTLYARGLAQKGLDTIRNRPLPPIPGQAQGGAINMKRGGAVFKKPVEYPAITAMRKK